MSTLSDFSVAMLLAEEGVVAFEDNPDGDETAGELFASGTCKELEEFHNWAEDFADEEEVFVLNTICNSWLNHFIDLVTGFCGL